MKTVARFPIGLEFMLYSKGHNKRRKFVGVLTTKNQDGEVVRVEYMCSHDFFGQKLTANYPEVAVARSLTPEELAAYPVPKARPKRRVVSKGAE